MKHFKTKYPTRIDQNVLEYVERPELVQMAKYIHKRSDNTKVEEYTPPTDALNYEVNSKTNFYSKHKYTYKIKSIYTGNVDKLIQNKVRNMMELQRMRNHLFNSPKSYERTENVYEAKYFKRPTYYVRRYNVLQKSGTSITTQWRNIKLHKLAKPIFAVNELNPFSEDRAKRDNYSKSEHRATKIAKLNYDNFMYIFNKVSQQLMKSSLITESSKPKKQRNRTITSTSADTYEPFVLKSFFDFIPRRDYDLRPLTSSEKDFNPYSKPYKFVSNYNHMYVIYI